MTTENNEYKFNLKTIVAVLFTTITVVGGAVYSVVKLSMDDKNSALELTISEKEKEIKKQETLINKLNKTSKSTHNVTIPAISQVRVEKEDDSPELDKLKSRIAILEQERNELLNELVEKSYNTLDPNSELITLLNELKSDSADIRIRGVNGLFILREPKSINALVNYYFDHNKEARRVETEIRWITLIRRMNDEAGLEFAIEIMKYNDDYISRWGYDYLYEYIRDKQVMNILIKKLNPVALNHQNSLVRTRAKKLIKNYDDIISGKIELPDNRSLYGILLDIEKKVDNL
ncbi:hypothetical protein MY04_1223 [Flammeovirga sp. MY04]|uniref:HEAT repeat domain-containing protein n=1 Tax=Flammeovirga sp. MY04 TaxID=1191459 RepID=UPI00080629B0|nr:hypothetical protein [Flammeovirga sp. MY04]ANQ48600.1 hypothetical protein MY04_1223 [Flammeovirga sp. MY04]